MMLKQLLFSAAVATVAISASAESKVLWQSEDPAGKLVGWGDPALTLTAEEAASIKAGDFLTMTVAGVDPENGWPQVALFQGNVGWPPAVNEGVKDKEYPYVASFGVTPEFADSIHAYGIVFKGDGAYVSAVGLKEGTINVGPNTVWFGPKQCGWGNGVSISNTTFANVAPGDKIVVEYDKEAAESTLQFLFGGWSGLNIPSYEAWKTDFLTRDEEAGTFTIALNSSLYDLTWGAEGEEQQYDVFALLKSGGLIMHGPCTVNQVLYIPAPLEYPEEMSFTLNGEAELPGVTATQEYTEGTISISVTGEYDADEIVMEFATPQGWDGMLVQSEITGGDIEYAKKAPVENDEYSWYPLEFGEAQGFKPGNSLTFPVNGEEQYGLIALVKGEQIYWATIDITFEVAKAAGAEPTFPKTIEYTINGEKELAGVDVVIKESEWGPSMSVTGKSDAETIALTFAVPEGWDGWIINADWAEVSEQPVAKTRSEEDWMPLDFYLQNMGFVKGNTVTFAVEEEDNYATLALYKGDKVYNATIDIEYNVVPAGGAVTTEPVFPESIGVTTYSEGLVEEQTNDEGQITVAITGEIEETTFDVVLDVPEGWDGFVSMVQSGEVTVSGNSSVDPRMTRAEEEGWISLEEALAAEGVQGNKFTFKANGERSHVEVYLYKGEQVYVANSITLTANVKKYVDPELEAANQEAYDKVKAEIDAVLAEYDEAVEFIKEYNPEFDFSDWTEVGKMINETAEAAEQALYSANEDGVEYNFAFSAEDYEGMIVEMKKAAVAEPNQEAYDKVKAEIDAVLAEYDEAVEFIKEYNPEFDFSDWTEVGKMINETAEAAEQALYSANEDGVEYNFAFSAEDYEGMIVEMKKAAVAEPNQAAYDKLIAELDELQKKSDEAAAQIKEMNPDYDLSSLDELNAMIAEYKEYALIALNNANEEGEAFFFPFDAEEYEAYIAMEVMTATPAPEYPETFDITSSAPTVEIAQEDFEGVTIVTVSGVSAEKEFTITVKVPEGWDGFIGASDLDAGNDPMPLQVVKETEWWFVSDMLAEGLHMTNSFTFPADGEEHYAQLMLVKGEYADVVNQINIDVKVTYDEATGVSINSVDSDAKYFDVNGNQIAKPAKGMYIKVVDGKATKVVVK